jgi:parallel beta-helix repeat protein
MSTITISPGANIQNVINSAPSGSTIVFTPGIYNVSQAISLKSGVSLEGQSGAELLSNGMAGIFKGQGVHDITISGFILDGHNGGPGPGSGAIYLDSSTGSASGTPSNNIHIVNNTFQNWTNSNDLWLWSTQNTYIQGNTLKNSYEGITWATDPGSPSLNNLVISDNVITGMKTMAIETAFSSTISNVHIDRNTINNIGSISISFVEGESGGNFQSGTVWGNHIDGTNSGSVLLELGNYIGPDHITVSHNVLSNAEWGMMFSHAAGAAVLDNTFTNVQNPFSDDGGYDATEWIGANTINGAQKTGWSAHGAYGNEPTVYSPSTPPSGVSSTSADTLTATGTTDAPLAPILSDTLLGSVEQTADFLQSTTSTSTTSTSQVSADSGVVSGTQASAGSGTLTQLAGGQLATDLTSIGSLNTAVTGSGSTAGTGTQTESASGIGAGFNNWDHGGKSHDQWQHHDTWRNS